MESVGLKKTVQPIERRQEFHIENCKFRLARISELGLPVCAGGGDGFGSVPPDDSKSAGSAGEK